MRLLEDDPSAVLASMPTMPPVFKTKPLVDFEVTFTDVDPKFIDYVLFGQSPGPQFPLGQE